MWKVALPSTGEGCACGGGGCCCGVDGTVRGELIAWGAVVETVDMGCGRSWWKRSPDDWKGRGLLRAAAWMLSGPKGGSERNACGDVEELG